MLDSFLIRLVAAARREGDIVGEVHVVATGETLIVRTGQELLDALVLQQPEKSSKSP